MALDDEPISTASSSDNVFSSDDVTTDAGNNVQNDDVAKDTVKDIEMDFKQQVNASEEANSDSVHQDDSLDSQDSSPLPQIVPEDYIIDDEHRNKDDRQENLFIDEENISIPQTFESNIAHDDNISDESNNETNLYIDEKHITSQQRVYEETKPSDIKGSLMEMEYEHIAQEANIQESDIPECEDMDTGNVTREDNEVPVNIPVLLDADETEVLPSRVPEEELREAGSWDVLGQSVSDTGPSEALCEELLPRVEAPLQEIVDLAVGDDGSSSFEDLKPTLDESLTNEPEHDVGESNTNSFEELQPTGDQIVPNNSSLDELTKSADETYDQIDGVTEESKSSSFPLGVADAGIPNVDSADVGVQRVKNTVYPPTGDLPEEDVVPSKEYDLLAEDNFPSDFGGRANAKELGKPCVPGNTQMLDIPVPEEKYGHVEHDLLADIQGQQELDPDTTHENLMEKVDLIKVPSLMTEEGNTFDNTDKTVDDINRKEAEIRDGNVGDPSHLSKPLDNTETTHWIDEKTDNAFGKVLPPNLPEESVIGDSLLADDPNHLSKPVDNTETTHWIDDTDNAFGRVLPPVPQPEKSVIADSLLAEDRYSQYDVVPESSDIISSSHEDSPIDNIVSTIKELIDKDKIQDEETPTHPPVKFDLASTPDTPKTPKFVQFKLDDEEKKVRDIPVGPPLSDRWLYYCPPVGLAVCGAYATDMDIGWFIILLSFCSMLSFVMLDLIRKD